ncbi:hypothetical protein C8039_16530 [Halogeometricum sp. wsp3]|nr:hypothetical protein C8039_16530 [Halogeometricum sp. wsp3]
MPGALFALAGYLYFTRDPPPVGFGVWGLWVVLGSSRPGAYAGPSRQIVDRRWTDGERCLAVDTPLGIACFTPVPFEISAV